MLGLAGARVSIANYARPLTALGTMVTVSELQPSETTFGSTALLVEFQPPHIQADVTLLRVLKTGSVAQKVAHAAAGSSGPRQGKTRSHGK